jgi:hypothetical protein
MSFKQFINEADEPTTITADTIIDVYFNNLDELTQKKIMDSLMVVLNISADDDYGTKKLADGFAKSPIISLTGKDISQKVKFDI